MIHLAGCIIFDTASRILLVHRSTPRRTRWEIPGGKVKEGELPEAAAERELEEELGLQVKVTRQLCTKSFEEDGHTMKYTWFLADVVSGTPVVREPALHDAFGYFTIAGLEEARSTLSPNLTDFLDWVVAGDLTL